MLLLFSICGGRVPYAQIGSLVQSFQNTLQPSAANSRQRIATNISPTSYQPREVQEICVYNPFYFSCSLYYNILAAFYITIF